MTSGADEPTAPRRALTPADRVGGGQARVHPLDLGAGGVEAHDREQAVTDRRGAERLDRAENSEGLAFLAERRRQRRKVGERELPAR